MVAGLGCLQAVITIQMANMCLARKKGVMMQILHHNAQSCRLQSTGGVVLVLFLLPLLTEHENMLEGVQLYMQSSAHLVWCATTALHA